MSDINHNNKNHSPAPYRAFIISLIAVLLVGGISFLPLSDLTGGLLSDFDLIADLRPGSTSSATAIDSVSREQAITDSLATIPDSVMMPEQSPLAADGSVRIEDYTLRQNGMTRLRQALADSTRLTRIAVLGDSYIEGDIMTQDLRDQLQTAFGGSGVGYMNLYSTFPGFRKSVVQSGGEWTEHNSKSKSSNHSWLGISQQYFSPAGNATATYAASANFANTNAWNKSQFLFIAPSATTIRTRRGHEPWESHSVEGSSQVQAITINGPASEISVAATTPSLIALGVWLDDTTGVSVDCMSMRGVNGTTLADVDSALVAQMRQFVDYDLIIVEFGINAMSAGQSDYTAYTKRMEKAIIHLRELYPDADILIMGVGDRGEKKGGTVQSMAVGTNMIKAQREMARRTRSFFFDTRRAMGGDNAIVQWSQQGWCNKDYVHLTHRGGRELASRLSSAIINDVNR